MLGFVKGRNLTDCFIKLYLFCPKHIRHQNLSSVTQMVRLASAISNRFSGGLGTRR